MSSSKKSPPTAVVGLDIGTDSIKVAEAKYGKDGINITALGIAPIPEGAIVNEVIVDPAALGKAIKALLNQSGIKTRTCVSAVAGQSQVVVRVIEVPRMNKQELDESMQWEIERHVPFSPTEIVKDYQPIEKPGADPNAQSMEVLLAVAQQQLIDNHVETLQAAGLKPVAIDIQSLAASRSLVETSQTGALDETVAIVDIGANNTELSVFEYGILAFPSPPLGIAGVSFTREIAEAMGQSLEQAETTKREYSAVDLSAFINPPVDAPADAPAAPASETTSFNTSVGASDLGTSIFDIPAAEPAQANDFTDTIDGPVFDNPLGGPAFDFGGDDSTQQSGPSFDLGDDQDVVPASASDLGGQDEAVSAAPSFDLGEDVPMAPAVPSLDPESDGTEAVAAAASDLGGDAEPAPAAPSPSFDLGDREEAEDEQVSPTFDLSDTNDQADPGAAQEQTQWTGPVAAQRMAQAVKVVPGSMEDQVFKSISSVLVDLADEIRRSIEYYITRYSKTPERVFLCGGTAKMQNIDIFLSQQLGIPVEVADPLKNLQVKVPAMSPQYMNEVSPLFTVSVGLAIRDMIG